MHEKVRIYRCAVCFEEFMLPVDVMPKCPRCSSKELYVLEYGERNECRILVS